MALPLSYCLAFCTLLLAAVAPLRAKPARVRSGTVSRAPARMELLPLGKQPAPDTVMAELDTVARGWGAEEDWQRWVRHLSNVPFDSPSSRADTSGDYAVVEYRPRHSKTKGPERFAIWVDRFNGRFWVVPQALQRAADRLLVDRGYNLREYTVTPEWRENRLYFTYNLAWYDPLTGEQREFEDGQMAVRADKEGKRIERRIFFWDGDVEPF